MEQKWHPALHKLIQVQIKMYNNVAPEVAGTSNRKNHNKIKKEEKKKQSM
jgi:hypothetical protein